MELEIDDVESIKIHCCGCESEVTARLTGGEEIYPHRADLADLPFWKCNDCGNFVGCHYKTKERIKPLGCIPTPAIKVARRQIHQILDPLWRSGRMKRGQVYARIAKVIGKDEYHTAEIRSVEEARDVYRVVQQMEVAVAAMEAK